MVLGLPGGWFSRSKCTPKLPWLVRMLTCPPSGNTYPSGSRIPSVVSSYGIGASEPPPLITYTAACELVGVSEAAAATPPEAAAKQTATTATMLPINLFLRKKFRNFFPVLGTCVVINSLSGWWLASWLADCGLTQMECTERADARTCLVTIEYFSLKSN